MRGRVVMTLWLVVGCTGSVDAPRAEKTETEYPMDEPPEWTESADAGIGSLRDPFEMPASDPIPADDEVGVCDVTAAETKAVLTLRCAGCHGQGPRIEGGFRDVEDLASLVERGLVVPFAASESPLFVRIDLGQMPPPGNPRVASSELARLREWIDCGARLDPEPMPSRTHVSMPDVLARMRTDLAQTSFDQRQDVRYIVLTHLYNAGTDDETLELYRQAVSLALNSLSRSFRIAVPLAIDPERTIFRIDLDDYDWGQRSWSEIERRYPYAVDYSRDASSLGFDSEVDRELREQTDSPVPFVFGDWLLAEATRGELYYALLELPDTLSELKSEIGVRRSPGYRAGFAESGVSFNNRVYEYVDAAAGGFWESFDFASSVGRQNVFEHPLDFEPNGGEMIFSLPNGLQGYYLSDAFGNRLLEAPRDIVADPSRPTRPIEAGVSCMGCHDATGIIPKADEVRNYVTASFDPGSSMFREVLEAYVQSVILEAHQRASSAQFRAARRLAGVEDASVRPVSVALNDYEGRIDARRVAATLGITEEELLAAIGRDPNGFPGPVSALQTPGHVLRREVFQSEFRQTVCALGLGRAIRCGDPIQACSCD